MQRRTNAGMVEVIEKEEWGITIAQMVENILNCYHLSEPIHKEQGAIWYSQEYSWCEQLAKETGVYIERVAYAVAVTSNNIRWEKQKSLSKDFILWIKYGNEPTGFKRGIIDRCAIKAAEIILHGNISACSGPKVNAFARNLLGEKHSVTVDRWALWVSLGRVVPEQLTSSWVRPGSRRRAVESAYHEAAYQLGMDVSTLQAITWLYAREGLFDEVQA